MSYKIGVTCVYNGYGFYTPFQLYRDLNYLPFDDVSLGCLCCNNLSNPPISQFKVRVMNSRVSDQCLYAIVMM